MKRIKLARIATFLLVFASLISILVVPASAAGHLDEILDYTVTVNMRTDGTMDMQYDITWKVLDSTSEGPLEWVKIGCPNSHVDEITALTRSTIKKISYMSEGGGSYIRVDLNRAYEAGEVIKFSYSIHQSYMYVIEEEQHICRYSFTPGWFDDIDVDRLTVYWNVTNVIDSTAPSVQGDYLVWSGTMPAGTRFNTSVRYNLDVFETNPDEQYVEGDNSGLSLTAIVLIIIGVVLVIMFIAFVVSIWADDYDDGRGMGGGYRNYGGHHTTIIHTGGSSHRSSCVSSCACASCACACACAGGGRAGCSMKDFYHTNLTSEMLERVLSDDEITK